VGIFPKVPQVACVRAYLTLGGFVQLVGFLFMKCFLVGWAPATTRGVCCGRSCLVSGRLNWGFKRSECSNTSKDPTKTKSGSGRWDRKHRAPPLCHALRGDNEGAQILLGKKKRSRSSFFWAFGGAEGASKRNRRRRNRRDLSWDCGPSTNFSGRSEFPHGGTCRGG